MVNATVTTIPNTDLSDKKTARVKEWIEKYIATDPTAMFAYGATSLRKTMQKDIGVEINDDQFNTIMVSYGHMPVDPEMKNWYYRLASDCPAIKPEFNGKRTVCEY